MKPSKSRNDPARKRRWNLRWAVPVMFLILAATLTGRTESQEPPMIGLDIAFETPCRMRPAVVFVHDRHNEKAGLESDCGTCHHVYQNGKRLEDDTSEGTACSECHGKEGKTELIITFHKQCKGCHQARNAGPVLCCDCHKRQCNAK